MAVDIRPGQKKKFAEERQLTTLDLIGQQILESLTTASQKVGSGLSKAAQTVGELTPIPGAVRSVTEAATIAPRLLEAFNEPVTENRPEGGTDLVRSLLSGEGKQKPTGSSSAAQAATVTADKPPSEDNDFLAGIDAAITKGEKDAGVAIGERVVEQQGLEAAKQQREQFANGLDANARSNIEQAQRAKNLLVTGQEEPNLLRRLLATVFTSDAPVTLESAQKVAGIEPIQPTKALEITAEAFKTAQESARKGLLKPNEIFTQFNKASGPFITQRDSIARVEASAVDPSGAGDLALIFNFMKILDPGSVVRESEFANAEITGPLLAKFFNVPVPAGIVRAREKLLRGGRLAPEQRNDFVSRARKLFAAGEKQQEKTTRNFVDLATRNGIDPANVIVDVGLAQDAKRITAQDAKARGAVAFNDATGQFVDVSGNPIR